MSGLTINFSLESLTRDGEARRNLDQILAFTHRYDTKPIESRPTAARSALELFDELSRVSDEELQKKLIYIHYWILESIIDSPLLSNAKKDALLDVGFDNPAADGWYVKSRFAALAATILCTCSLASTLKNEDSAPSYNFSFETLALFLLATVFATASYLLNNEMHASVTESSRNYIQWLEAFATALKQQNLEVNLDLEENNNHQDLPIAEVVNTKLPINKPGCFNRIRYKFDLLGFVDNNLDKYHLDYLISSADTRRQVDKIILFSDKLAIRGSREQIVPPTSAAKLFLDLKKTPTTADEKLNQVITKAKHRIQHATTLTQSQRDVLLDVILVGAGEPSKNVQHFKRWAAKMSEQIKYIDMPGISSNVVDAVSVPSFEIVTKKTHTRKHKGYTLVAT